VRPRRKKIVEWKKGYALVAKMGSEQILEQRTEPQTEKEGEKRRRGGKGATEIPVGEDP